MYSMQTPIHIFKAVKSCHIAAALVMIGVLSLGVAFPLMAVEPIVETLAKLPAPRLSSPGDSYTQDRDIEPRYRVWITSPTAGVTIKYTLDGSDPVEFGTVYTGAIPVTFSGERKAMQVKAIALMEGYENSDVAARSYVTWAFGCYDDFDLYTVQIKEAKQGHKRICGTITLYENEEKLFSPRVKIRVVEPGGKTQTYDVATKRGKWAVRLTKKLGKCSSITVKAYAKNRVFFFWQTINTGMVSVEEEKPPPWQSASIIVDPSTNADLKSIKLSSGKLSLPFGKNRTWYRVQISGNRNSATITARKASAVSKMQMRAGLKGSYKQVDSVKINLRKGQSRNVFIRVTSQSGKQKTYVVNVTRKR